LKTSPLPEYWIELRFVAPIASAAAASRFVCASLCVDSITANPAMIAQRLCMVVLPW
jgi:hypothetical protein